MAQCMDYKLASTISFIFLFSYKTISKFQSNDLNPDFCQSQTLLPGGTRPNVYYQEFNF